MMGSFGCHSSLFWRSPSWYGVEVGSCTYLITSPSVWSYHMTCDAIASFFTSETFLPVSLFVSDGASFPTSRCLSLQPLSDLSVALTRCLYEHLRVWRSENPIICHLLLLWASAHLDCQIICQGRLPLVGIGWERISTCLIGLAAHQTVLDSTIFLLMRDHSSLLIHQHQTAQKYHF